MTIYLYCFICSLQSMYFHIHKPVQFSETSGCLVWQVLSPFHKWDKRFREPKWLSQGVSFLFFFFLKVFQLVRGRTMVKIEFFRTLLQYNLSYNNKITMLVWSKSHQKFPHHENGYNPLQCQD